jgi:predicted membrane-bound spermidine synthase
MSPNWLGSPQHVVAGFVLALGVGVWARRRVDAAWQLAGLALAVTMAAEALVELAEYPLLYSGHLHVTAYYDTIADIGATLAGAIAGTLVALALRGRVGSRSRPRRG